MSRYSNILMQADIFYQFPIEHVAMVSEICTEKTLNAGEIIFEENTKSGELYIIAQGEVDILINPSLVSEKPNERKAPVTIAILRRGQSFGEVALVDQGLRTATARTALNNTRLIIIPRDKLMELCNHNNELGYRLMRNLAADLSLKIRNTDLKIRENVLSGARQR